LPTCRNLDNEKEWIRTFLPFRYLVKIGRAHRSPPLSSESTFVCGCASEVWISRSSGGAYSPCTAPSILLSLHGTVNSTLHARHRQCHVTLGLVPVRPHFPHVSTDTDCAAFGMQGRQKIHRSKVTRDHGSKIVSEYTFFYYFTF
jgi:hypothetical protein